MSRSLLQVPSKKSVDNSSQLKQSRGRLFQGKMGNFTEVLVQTNDIDVPFIAIYKPDIKRQQRRIQAVITLQKNLKKFQLIRLQLAFNKLNYLKHKQQTVSRNVQQFQQLFSNLQNRRLSQGFLQLSANKTKKKSAQISAKLLHAFELKARTNNIKHGMNQLKFNYCQSLISSLSNENQLSLELSQVKKQLFDLKLNTFQKQFVEASKQFQRFNDHNAFIDQIREANYQQSVRLEHLRFEQSRSKIAPKKKDPFDNQIIATTLNNAIKAYEACISDHINYQQELKRQLEGYTNTEGISELSEMIKSKDSILSDLESFVAEMTRMDTQLKRFSGDKFNSEKILSLIAQQQKKLETRSKKSQGIVPKIYNSRIFLDSLILSSIKRSNEEKQSIIKQSDEQKQTISQRLNQERQSVMKMLEDLIEASKEQSNLQLFIRKIKNFPLIKSISNMLLVLSQNNNEFSRINESLKAQSANSAKQIETLKAENRQNKQKIKSVSDQIQKIKAINENDKKTIQYLFDFINKNQQMIRLHEDIDLSIRIKLTSDFKPIFGQISNLLKLCESFQKQKRQFLKQIEELERRQPHSFSDTKPIQVPSTPNGKIEIRDSQISIADRFISPLKQMLENRHEDKQLKDHIILFQQKIEELINQNKILQERILSLQGNQKVIDEKSQRINQLKEKNEHLKSHLQSFNQINMLYEQSKERIKFFTEENVRLNLLANQASQTEFKLRQLSLANHQLAQQIALLRESNYQFSNIANTNLQLSEKINQIYHKSSSKVVVEGNQQQLVRQTQLMQEILTLKIESQNTMIKHMHEINALKSQINSYQTIITKYEIDITHREKQISQKQSAIKSLNAQQSELKQTNLELRQKIEEMQRTINSQTNRNFKDNEEELILLRQDCQNIYADLQRNIQQLRAKDTHIISLQTALGSQEEFINNLRKENERLMTNIQDLIGKNQDLEQNNSRYKVELNQLKNQYHQLQSEYHKTQISQTNIEHTTVVYQKQIQDKQTIINSLMEQLKSQSASFTSQLQQIKQEHISKERVFQERLSDKDVKISKLQFELNQKLNTVMSLEQLISLYAQNSAQTTIKQEVQHFAYPCSRDKQILYLRGQIKSLQEFLNDLNNQYQELEKRYQQERERTNRGYLNISPINTERIMHEGKDFKTTIFESGQNKQVKFFDEVSDKFNHSFMSNINMTFTEGDITKQLNRLMAINESFASSVEYLRQENKQLVTRFKNITSVDMVIELVFNILLAIRKQKPDTEHAGKIWQDLNKIKAAYAGETLFINLEDYCRSFVSSSA